MVSCSVEMPGDTLLIQSHYPVGVLFPHPCESPSPLPPIHTHTHADPSPSHAHITFHTRPKGCHRLGIPEGTRVQGCRGVRVQGCAGVEKRVLRVQGHRRMRVWPCEKGAIKMKSRSQLAVSSRGGMHLHYGCCSAPHCTGTPALHPAPEHPQHTPHLANAYTQICASCFVSSHTATSHAWNPCKCKHACTSMLAHPCNPGRGYTQQQKRMHMRTLCPASAMAVHKHE